jgi:hypothetical protein
MLMGVDGFALTPTANFLAYPRLHDECRFPPGWQLVARGEMIDALVLTAAVPDHALRTILAHIGDPLVPIVSLVPDERQGIDAAGQGEQFAWERAYAIQAKLRELPVSIRHSAEPEDILLARVYSRDQGLVPIHDPGLRDLVRYPVAGALDNVSELAAGLDNKGYLRRRFFDRLFCCPQCRSAHLSVREECHSCRSANISEEVVVHHFQCAHEAPESQFRSHGGFTCPKCARPLRHIGLDYDKPGSITRCFECGAINDKPAVGFKCIDCGAHHAPDQVPARTWYAYSLTAVGQRRVLRGAADESLPAQPGLDRFQLLLDHTRKEQREFGSPYQVANVTFTNRELIAEQDLRLWEQSLQLVGDTLHSALREVDAVREHGEGFLILMPRTGPHDAARALQLVAGRIRSVLKVDPGFRFTLVDDVVLEGLRSRQG